MLLSDFRTHNTPYQNLIFDRYSKTVPEYPSTSEEHSERGIFEFVLEAPFYYEVEEEMMEYAKAHPEATVFDLDNYFESIVPPQTFRIVEPKVKE